MNLNIYLEDSLGQQLTSCAKKLHRKKNTIIREALKEWINRHTKKSWPKSIMDFKGAKEFPTIEELRSGLTPPTEDLF